MHRLRRSIFVLAAFAIMAGIDAQLPRAPERSRNTKNNNGYLRSSAANENKLNYSNEHRALGKSGKGIKSGKSYYVANTRTEGTTTSECVKWETSTVTELKPQYYVYKVYSSKSAKSAPSPSKGVSKPKTYYYSKSGKGSKGGKGRKLHEKTMMKYVEVTKQVKTCAEFKIHDNVFDVHVVGGKSGKGGKAAGGKGGKSGLTVIEITTDEDNELDESMSMSETESPVESASTPAPNPSPESGATPAPQSGATTPAPQSGSLTPAPTLAITPAPQSDATTPAPQTGSLTTPAPQSDAITPAPQSGSLTTPAPQIGATPAPQSGSLTTPAPQFGATPAPSAIGQKEDEDTAFPSSNPSSEPSIQSSFLPSVQPSLVLQNGTVPTLPPDSSSVAPVLSSLAPQTGSSLAPAISASPTLPPGLTASPVITENGTLPTLSPSTVQNVSLPTLSPSPSLASQNGTVPTTSPSYAPTYFPSANPVGTVPTSNSSPSPSLASQENATVPTLPPGVTSSPAGTASPSYAPTYFPSANPVGTAPTSNSSPSPSLASQENATAPTSPPGVTSSPAGLSDQNETMGEINGTVPTISPAPSVANGTSSSVPTISPAPSIVNETSSAVPTVANGTSLSDGQNGTSSLVPTISPAPSVVNETSSSVPTVANGTSSGDGPAGSLYYEGFESGQFPVAPWITDGDAPWVIDTEHARSGTYSIKSGTLDLTDLTTKYSNLTYTTNPDWPDGSLILSALGGTSMPHDELSYFVDGEMRGKLPQSTVWQQLRIPLPPGSHTILFSYITNPAGLQQLPPPPDPHLEAVYFDNVYFIPSGVTAAPTEESTVLAPSVASTTPPADAMTSPTPTLPPGTSLPPAVPTSTPQNEGLTTLPPGSSPSPMVSSLPPGITSQPSLSSLPPQSNGNPTLPPGTSLPPAVPTSTPQNDMPTLPPASSSQPGDLNTLSWDFESGVFPEAPWTTGGDGDWAIDQTQVDGGLYSIKSPDFETGYSGEGTRISNATLTLDDTFTGGLLNFTVYASVQPPRDILVLYIDGESRSQQVATDGFVNVVQGMGPGAHVITFSYQYNPYNQPELFDSPPDRLGAAWIDNVVIMTNPGARAKAANFLTVGSLPQSGNLPTLQPATSAPTTSTVNSFLRTMDSFIEEGGRKVKQYRLFGHG